MSIQVLNIRSGMNSICLLVQVTYDTSLANLTQVYSNATIQMVAKACIEIILETKSSKGAPWGPSAPTRDHSPLAAQSPTGHTRAAPVVCMSPLQTLRVSPEPLPWPTPQPTPAPKPRQLELSRPPSQAPPHQPLTSWPQPIATLPLGPTL